MKKNLALPFLLLLFFSFTLMLSLVVYGDPGPDYRDCGIIPAKKVPANGANGSNEPDLLISDGDVVPSITEMPWMAKLVAVANSVGNTSGKVTECTGAIISDWHILTAAHCVADLTVDRIRVFLGNEDWSKSTIFNVSEKHLHDDYEPHSLKNDIAVLKLEKKMQFDDKTHPICLTGSFNEKGFFFEGDINTKYTEATIAGWRFTEINGPESKYLLQGQVQFLDDKECTDIDKQILQAKGEQETDWLIKEKYLIAICAQGKKGNLEKGDDGAPMMLQAKDENGVTRWMVVGVSSGNLEQKNTQQTGSLSVFTGLQTTCYFIEEVSGVVCHDF